MSLNNLKFQFSGHLERGIAKLNGAIMIKHTNR